MNLNHPSAAPLADSASHHHSEATDPLETLKVAVVQYRGDNATYHQTRDHLLSVLEETAQSGVSLIVAPECAASDYLFKDADEARRYAETLDGELANALRDIAQRYACWCFVGVVELSPSGQLFNTTFIAPPQGSLRHYRKRLLFDADTRWALSGDDYPAPPLASEPWIDIDRATLQLDEPDAPYPLFNVFGWRVTTGICMDLNDPRFIAFCEQAEVDLIAFPTNWLDEGHEITAYWAYLLQNLPYATLLAANSHGAEGEITFSGGSSILQATPPTLIGRAPPTGDYVISVTLNYRMPITSMDDAP